MGKDQHKEIVEENKNSMSKSGEQGKNEETTKFKPVEPYRPPIPFPQRLAKAKLEAKFRKSLEVLKKLYINIPVLDAISEMPSCEKFLKKCFPIRGNFKRMPWSYSRKNIVPSSKSSFLPSSKTR